MLRNKCLWTLSYLILQFLTSNSYADFAADACPDSVSITPNPETHLSSSAATILTNDEEEVVIEASFTLDCGDSDPSVGGKEECCLPPETFVATFKDPGIGAFVQGSGLVSTVQILIGQPNPVKIRGIGKGDTLLEVRRDSASGEVVKTLPVRVGGSLTFEFNNLPTFVVPSGSSIGEPGATFPIAEKGPEFVGGSEVLGSQPDARAPFSSAVLTAISDFTGYTGLTSTFRVVVKGADGKAKPGKAVKLLPLKSEHLWVGPVDTATEDLDQPPTTNSQGYAEFTIISTLAENLVKSTDSFFPENIAGLVGRSVKLYESGEISKSLIDAQRSSANMFKEGTRTFRGRSIRVTSDLDSCPFEQCATMQALNFPILNDADIRILQRQLEPNGFPLPTLQNKQIAIIDPQTGKQTHKMIDLGPSLAAIVNQPKFSRAVETEVMPLSKETWLQMVQSNGWEMDYKVEIPVNGFAGDLPPPGEAVAGTIVTVAAIASDFALAFVPGWDLVDVIKYGFWKPVFNDEADFGNYLTATIAFVGLAADAGYLAAVIPGFATNAAASALKVVVKYVPMEAIMAIIKRCGTSVRAAIEFIINYAKRIPMPMSADVTEWMNWGKEVAVHLINQWNYILHSPLHLGGDDVGESFAFVGGKLNVIASDEAAEGVAYALKTGYRSKMDDLAAKFPGKAVVQASEAMAILAKRGIWPMSEEAMTGLAVFAKAQISPDHLKKIAKSANITSWRAEDLFSSFAHLDGVDGLDQLSKFIFNNVDNANGIDGAIFESVVAAAIKKKEIDDAGALVRVSADGIPGMNKVDTATTEWGIQIKHKTGQGAFGLSDLNQNNPGEYLAKLKAQVTRAGLSPYLIINKEPSDAFEAILNNMGIFIEVVD